MLHLSDVQERVEKIRSALNKGPLPPDNEVAHMLEDALHRDVLQAIAENRCSDPSACAAAALTTEDIDFTRWYA